VSVVLRGENYPSLISCWSFHIPAMNFANPSVCRRFIVDRI